MKTYDLICPNCEEELKMEMDPKSAEEAEIIECPECLYEAAWTHDEVTDSVTLIPDVPVEDVDIDEDDDEEVEDDEEEFADDEEDEDNEEEDELP